MSRNRRSIASAIVAGFFTVTLAPLGASAQEAQGTLFYTRFQIENVPNEGTIGNGEVKKVDFSYDGVNTVTFTNKVLIKDLGAQQSSADGIVFAPDGDLLVAAGGQSSGGRVHKIDPSTGAIVETRSSGTGGAFHLAIDPSQTRFFSIGETSNASNSQGVPGPLSSFPLPFQTGVHGTPKTLTGDDPKITSIAFVGDNVFYTSNFNAGPGSFGRIDLDTGVTNRLLSNVPAAHAMVFDPFTGDLLLSGVDHVTQINVDDPNNPSIVGDLDLTIPTDSGFLGDVDDKFDQLAVDGQGHLFAMVQNGNVFFLDYSTSGDVDAGDFSSFLLLEEGGYLSGVAPLAGPGSLPGTNGGGNDGGGNDGGGDDGGETDGGSNGEPPVIPLPVAAWPALSLLGAIGIAKKLGRRRSGN